VEGEEEEEEEEDGVGGVRGCGACGVMELPSRRAQLRSVLRTRGACTLAKWPALTCARSDECRTNRRVAAPTARSMGCSVPFWCASTPLYTWLNQHRDRIGSVQRWVAVWSNDRAGAADAHRSGLKQGGWTTHPSDQQHQRRPPQRDVHDDGLQCGATIEPSAADAHRSGLKQGGWTTHPSDQQHQRRPPQRDVHDGAQRTLRARLGRLFAAHHLRWCGVGCQYTVNLFGAWLSYWDSALVGVKLL
jgi:hypothetical protein